MTGIKESKELITFIARLGSAIKGALEDGQIGFTDIQELFGPIMASKAAFEDVQLIPAELADLSQTEASELVATLQRELDLDGSEAEFLTEEGLALAFALVSYVNKLRGVE